MVGVEFRDSCKGFPYVAFDNCGSCAKPIWEESLFLETKVDGWGGMSLVSELISNDIVCI